MQLIQIFAAALTLSVYGYVMIEQNRKRNKINFLNHIMIINITNLERLHSSVSVYVIIIKTRKLLIALKLRYLITINTITS